jgi:hypothetical protein
MTSQTIILILLSCDLPLLDLRLFCLTLICFDHQDASLRVLCTSLLLWWWRCDMRFPGVDAFYWGILCYVDGPTACREEKHVDGH